MLSNVTKKDRLAIFQKLSPVSISRLFRTCKWANQFIEDNKRNIKIHTEKSLIFYFKMEFLFENDASGGNNYKHVYSIQSESGTKLNQIPYKPTELETILPEVQFQCFVFETVRQIPLPTILQGQLEDNTHILEGMATVPARNLVLWWPTGAPVPPFPYNYESVKIFSSETQMVAIFDFIQTHRSVSYSSLADEPPLEDTVSLCCELMQTIIDGNTVTKSLDLTLGGQVERPAALDWFLVEKGSETIEVDGGLEFQLIPVSPESFLAVLGCSEKDEILRKLAFQLIAHKADFYAFYKDLHAEKFDKTLSDEEIGSKSAVQEICARFFA